MRSTTRVGQSRPKSEEEVARNSGRIQHHGADLGDFLQMDPAGTAKCGRATSKSTGCTDRDGDRVRGRNQDRHLNQFRHRRRCRRCRRRRHRCSNMCNDGLSLIGCDATATPMSSPAPPPAPSPSSTPTLKPTDTSPSTSPPTQQTPRAVLSLTPAPLPTHWCRHRRLGSSRRNRRDDFCIWPLGSCKKDAHADADADEAESDSICLGDPPRPDTGSDPPCSALLKTLPEPAPDTLSCLRRWLVHELVSVHGEDRHRAWLQHHRKQSRLAF